MHHDRKDVLLIISSSWGAIDWIMPVIVGLRKKYSEITITGITIDEALEKLFLNNIFLRDLCFEFCDRVITLNQFKKEVLFPSFLYRQLACGYNYCVNLEKNIKNIILLKYLAVLTRKVFRASLKIYEYCFSKQSNFYKNCFDRFPYQVLLRDLCGAPEPLSHKIFIDIARKNNVLDVLYPPTTDFYYYTKNNPDEIKWKHSADIFLCNSGTMSNNFINKEQNNKNKRIIAIPRYDKWWIETVLLRHELYDEVRELKNKCKVKNVYLLLIRGPMDRILTTDSYDYLMKNAIDTIAEDRNSFLIIKAHPRQSIEEIGKYLHSVKLDRWVVSGLHGMFLGSIADVVISFAVSVLFDILCLNKPVIEFYRYGSEHTHYTEDWRELGLVIPANTKDELRSAIKNINKNNNSCSENFHKIIPMSQDNNTNNVINELMAINH